MVERLLERVDADELYAVTGTQFLPITTACQLLAMQGSPALAQAERLATIPDLFAVPAERRPGDRADDRQHRPALGHPAAAGGRPG